MSETKPIHLGFMYGVTFVTIFWFISEWVEGTEFPWTQLIMMVVAVGCSELTFRSLQRSSSNEI